MAQTKRKQLKPSRSIEPVPSEIKYKNGIVSLYSLGTWLSSDEEQMDTFIAKPTRRIKIKQVTKPFPPKKRQGGRGHFSLKDAEGLELLDDQEITVCNNLRLMPLHYLNCKKIMMEQSKIRGFYKKSNAQKMLRIDVNKTGKLYEFFAKRGWILSE